MKTRGIALVTATFVVLLVYGLVTGILLQTRGDLAVTRYASERIVARSAARSAVEYALYGLNSDPLWESAHTVPYPRPAGPEPPACAATSRLGEQTVYAWTEATEFPDILRVRGQAQVGGQQATSMTVVRKQLPGAPGVLAQGGKDQPVGPPKAEGPLYSLSPDGRTWTKLPPSPQMGWAGPGRPVLLGSSPALLRHPVEGPGGAVYALLRTDQGNVVVMLDPQTQQWGLLPPLEGVRTLAVNGQGTLYGAVSTDHPDRGENMVYALTNPAQAVTRLDPATQTFTLGQGSSWSGLPPLPRVEFVNHQAMVPQTESDPPARFQGLSADDAGHVWVRQGRVSLVLQDGDPVGVDVQGDLVPCGYDPATRTWSAADPIPSQERGGSPLHTVRKAQKEEPDDLNERLVACDPQGNLIVETGLSMNGVRTLCMFKPEWPGTSGRLNGRYTLLRPAPARKRHVADGQEHLGRLATDATNQFFFSRHNIQTRDPVFHGDAASGSHYQGVPAIPRNDDGDEVQNILYLGSTRRVNPSGAPRYVPQYSD